MLDVQIDRAIRVVLEGVAIANGVSLQAIIGLVVQRNRPESLSGRNPILGEVQHGLVCPGQRVAVRIAGVRRIDRVLGQVGAQTDQRDNGQLDVVVPIHTHRVRVHLPAIHDAGKRWNLCPHGLKSVRRCALQCTLDSQISFPEIKGLAGLDPDLSHPGDNGLVCDVRRIDLQEFSGVAENMPTSIRSTCVIGGVFMSTVGSIVALTGC